MAELIQRPGISPDTLAALGIRHVTEAEASELIGQKYSGLYIPYGVHVDGKPFGRLRLDQPQDERKYTQRTGSGVHPYIPALPGLETQDDLVIIEGEFKAIALCEAGFHAIGISGFNGFAQEGQLCPRLANHLKDHPPQRILFVGDNDTALNFQFSDAAMKLAKLVDPVPVVLPRIPLSMPKGVDDCREQLGPDAFPAWWAALVAAAVSLPLKLRADMLSLELFKLAVPDLKLLAGIERSLVLQKIGKLASCMQAMARAELAEICKKELGITKSTLQQVATMGEEDPLASKEEWTSVGELYGDAMFISKDGKSLTGLNERFWAGMIRERHLLLHEPNEKRFFRYDKSTGLWMLESHAVLAQLACDTVNGEINSDPRYLKFAQLSFGHAVVGHLEGMNEQRGAFEETPCGIHVANGFLVIGEDSIELQPFSPSHYSRNQAPIRFDPGARCPMFMEKILMPAMDEEDIALFQYYMGQCLLGRNLTQTILLLHGPGSASKGTLSNIVQQVIGERNCYELRTDHVNERFELFRYIGRTLLYGADVEPGFLRTEGAHMLKKLVGDDLISPEGKNSNEVFAIRGNFNVLITCNKRLSVRLSGDVSAWRRRLRILAFKEPAKGRKTIVNLDKLIIDKEGSGILNWAIVGAAQVLADKRAHRVRELSPGQHQRLETLLGQSDSVRHFLEERVERRHGESLEKNDILEAYADYCGEKSWEPLPDLAARKELNNRMLELFGSVERKSAGSSHNQRGYSNVAFKNEPVP
ncbi:MAG: phage/plasmid primase, P4 family [Verrucomicrobiota bacterium]